MKKIIFLVILLIFICSISHVTATNVNDIFLVNNINTEHILKDSIEWMKTHYNKLDKLYFDYNRTYQKSNITNYTINKDNELNISKEVNLTNNSIDPKLNNNLINNSSNIYHNKSNLVNSSINKDKHNVGLFNGTLYNQNQYNKTCKLLGLNHSINNDSIFNDKKLNNSKSNSNICDDSREDNFLINHVPESDNKDYNILLLILLFLLVLLGAIILYKIKK